MAVPSSGGVAFRIVMAMKPRYAGEARAALLAAMTANMWPKIVIVVDPDIDVHDPVQVDWACGFRMQPARDLIVVERSVERGIGRWRPRQQSTLGRRPAPRVSTLHG